MLETGEALGLLLAALGLGALLPVVIQLFLTLRELRLTVRRLSTQIEPSLQLLNNFAQQQQQRQQRQSEPGPPHLATIVSALVPAIMSSYQAFRAHQAAEHKAADEQDAESCEPPDPE